MHIIVMIDANGLNELFIAVYSYTLPNYTSTACVVDRTRLLHLVRIKGVSVTAASEVVAEQVWVWWI